MATSETYERKNTALLDAYGYGDCAGDCDGDDGDDDGDDADADDGRRW